jgi:hypothetical protein
MGRIMPSELVEDIGRYLHLRTPEREDELLAMIRTRAEELAKADKDLPVDGQSEGFLAHRCSCSMSSGLPATPVRGRPAHL